MPTNVNLLAAGALKLVERMNGCAEDCKRDANKIRMEYDDRDKKNINIVSNSAAYLYAFRPLQDSRAPEFPYLSLYGFSGIGVLSWLPMSYQIKNLKTKRRNAIMPGSRWKDVRKSQRGDIRVEDIALFKEERII